MTVTDRTTAVLQVVIAAIVIIAERFVIPALRAYIQGKKTDEIYSMIETAVRAAEQTITDSGSGELKKKQVTTLVTTWLEERNIKISSTQLDQMIEECVYLLSH